LLRWILSWRHVSIPVLIDSGAMACKPGHQQWAGKPRRVFSQAEECEAGPPAAAECLPNQVVKLEINFTRPRRQV